MNRFFSSRLGDLSAARGEKFVTSLVSGFSCPRNVDVENFLHNGAVVSAQMGSSITHLVFDQSDASCVGGKRITGVNLLDIIYQQLKEVRSRIGGRVVFIECEQGVPKLTEFYKRNGFAKFDSRVSKVDGKTYDMMFRFLSMS